MSRSNTSHLSIFARGIAISLGLLLIPLTLTPSGVEENLACGSEADGNCVRFSSSICIVDGEFVQHWRMVE